MSQEDKQSQSSNIAKYIGTGNDNALSVGLQFTDYKELLGFADILASGKGTEGNKLCPLKTKEEVFVALLAGASMGLPIHVSLNNIVPINGKATLSNNLQMALLKKAGVIMKIDEDCESLYPVFYYDYDEEFKAKTYVKEGKTLPVILETKLFFKSEIDLMMKEWKDIADMGVWNEAEKKAHMPKAMWKPAGKGTKVTLTRQVLQPNGEYLVETFTRSYSTIDAAKVTNANGQSVLETKDSWKNYLPDMLFANAFRRTAKLIGNDILMALNSTEEMLDTTNINYDLTDEGEIKIKDKAGKVTQTTKASPDVEDVDHEEVTDSSNTKESTVSTDLNEKEKTDDNTEKTDESVTSTDKTEPTP